MTKIILALDTFSLKEADELVRNTAGLVDIYKIGPQLTLSNLHGIHDFLLKVPNIFFDFKFHDIPNTMKNSVEALVAYAPDFMTLHCSSGPIALSVCSNVKLGNTKLLGVTVLTSMDDSEWAMVNNVPIERYIRSMTGFSSALIQGVVCDNASAPIVKLIDPSLITVVPGFRLDDNVNDQSRIATPETLHKESIDYVVIGRTVLNADDPVAKLEEIKKAIK